MKGREYIKMENRSADEAAACDYSDKQIEPMPLVGPCVNCLHNLDEQCSANKKPDSNGGCRYKLFIDPAAVILTDPD